MSQTREKLKNAVVTTRDLYCRLILLVGESCSGKTQVLQSLAKEMSVSIINLNLTLATQLLEILPSNRPIKCSRILQDAIAEDDQLLILDNIEILFDRSLHQDPLRLLQGIARDRSVIAAWNGRYNGVNLTYAAIDHPEYRSYDAVDTLIVTMEGESAGHEI